MLILLLCYVSLYIVYVVGDSILAQETASLCCDEDVVLQTDASKVLVGLYLIKAEEFCTMSFALPVVDERRDKVDAWFVGNDKSLLQTASHAKTTCSELVEIWSYLIIKANIHLIKGLHVVYVHAHHMT